jgi:DNA-directed RNA polymerase specialized sigma24 family protein
VRHAGGDLAYDRRGERHPAWSALAAWLTDDRSIESTRRVLQRMRLPDVATDLHGDAICKVSRYLGRHPDSEIQNPEYWCRRMLRNMATDLARGGAGYVLPTLGTDRGAGHVADVDDLDQPFDIDDEHAPGDVPVTGGHGGATPARVDEAALARWRVAVEAHPGQPVEVRAAAMAFIVLTELAPTGSSHHVLANVPQPRAGSTSQQALMWAALHFAGESRIFPGVDGDPAARRRLRSRRMERVFEFLELLADRDRSHRPSRGEQ